MNIQYSNYRRGWNLARAEVQIRHFVYQNISQAFPCLSSRGRPWRSQRPIFNVCALISAAQWLAKIIYSGYEGVEWNVYAGLWLIWLCWYIRESMVVQVWCVCWCVLCYESMVVQKCAKVTRILQIVQLQSWSNYILHQIFYIFS